MIAVLFALKMSSGQWNHTDDLLLLIPQGWFPCHCCIRQEVECGIQAMQDLQWLYLSVSEAAVTVPRSTCIYRADLSCLSISSAYTCVAGMI